MSVINVREVTKTYDTPQGPFTALRCVSLKTDPGEFLAVVGRTATAITDHTRQETARTSPTKHTSQHTNGHSLSSNEESARSADLVRAPCRIRTCAPGSGEGCRWCPHAACDLRKR
ncbi:hypothetical protein GCM10020216_066100 [Nonomuraea helvata]